MTELTTTQINQLFTVYPILDKIGRNHFSIKLWIILKGMEARNGESILLASLGHNPCVAMMEKGHTHEDIRHVVEELIKNKIIIWENNHMVEHSKRFQVLSDVAYQINQITHSLKLEKKWTNGTKCMQELQVLDFRKVGEAHWYEKLKSVSDNFIYVLNNNNGLATAKLYLQFLWDVYQQNVSESSNVSV